MIINLWYVAEWSKTVKDKPVKAKVLDQHLVLFRNEQGEIQCLADVCLHRGGSLSNGWVTDGNVTCPYHGWEFEGSGQCVHVPSAGRDFKVPDRFKVDQYDAVEKYGMIWVFMGDLPEEERFPIPPLPEFDDPNWKMLEAEVTWKSEAARVVENGIDIAHTSFVHPGFGGDSTTNEIDSVENNEYWGKSVNYMRPPAMKGWRKNFRKEGQRTRATPEWYLPGFIVRLQVDINEKMKIIMFDANTPVDENTTRTFALSGRNFFPQKIFDKGSLKRLHGVFREDLTIVEATQPHYLPETMMNEVSVEQDKFMAGFRLARRRLIEKKGWQIDSFAKRDLMGRKVVTIPSPNRKAALEAGKGWVFDTVPMVAAKDTTAKEEETEYHG